jgi:hypothetical protein
MRPVMEPRVPSMPKSVERPEAAEALVHALGQRLGEGAEDHVGDAPAGLGAPSPPLTGIEGPRE